MRQHRELHFAFLLLDHFVAHLECRILQKRKPKKLQTPIVPQRARNARRFPYDHQHIVVLVLFGMAIVIEGGLNVGQFHFG